MKKRLMLLVAGTVSAILLGEFIFSNAGAKFRSDDPLTVDADQLPIPLPNPVRLSQIFDFVENSFGRCPDKKQVIPPAENVNTLGEVPDSSWFSNRMGKKVMTIEELVRGPNQRTGPDQSKPWAVIGMKSQGITPGFTIRDGRKDTYFIKFDPPRHPQLSTSTEVISTKFFHAFGYHVPENYLAHIQRQDLVIGSLEGECSRDCAIQGHEHRWPTLVDEEGKERSIRDSDIDKVFKKAFQDANGGTPVVASYRLKGKPVGPFKYFGIRSDDANDIFPHQNRRELRGLRVFASWLNHDDSRSINSLDMYVGEPGKGSLKHYLMDFGSCLGSGSVRFQSRRAGNEYMFEWTPGIKSALTLGLWDRAWRHVKYPDYSATGRFEADFFEPQNWKPEYPNPAFDRMQVQDAFWATRIVLRFTDEMIRAIVKEGRIEDGEADQYLVETLIKRRDKIVGHHLSRSNPLDDFQIHGEGESRRIEFKNLAIDAGLANSSSYRYRWFRFDNKTGVEAALADSQTLTGASLPVPQMNSDYLLLRIGLISPEQPNWEKQVAVYLRNRSGVAEVAGIDR